MTRRVWTVAVLCAVAIGLAFVWAWGPSQAIWPALMAQIEALGPWIGVGLIAMMVLHNVVPVPAELIAVTAGAVLGLVQGVVVIWVGAMLGAVLAFWVARRFGRRFLQGGRIAPQLARFDRFVAAGDWRGLLVMRLVPVVSFNLLNYAAGLAGVGWPRFLWTTALGIVPLTILSVAAGAGMHSLGFSTALGVAAVFALGWLALHVYMRRMPEG